MYKWKIEIILNCGKEIVGQFECEHNDSWHAAEKLFGGDINKFTAIYNLDKTAQIFFKLCDVSSMSISVLEEEDETN